MADCELLATCPFFNDRMANMPTSAAMFKKIYCHKDRTDCARYAVFKALGREKVPSDLFPNEMVRARRVIRQGA